MSNELQPKLADKLRYLDEMTLQDMAEFFERHADICREQAAQNAASEAEMIAAGINYLLAAPRIVRRYLRQGYCLEKAAEKTAIQENLPLPSVMSSWRRFCHDKSRYELARRNTLIIELAALGLSNADIGKRVNLHPNSVSRIISNARKAYRYGRQASQENFQVVLRSGAV